MARPLKQGLDYFHWIQISCPIGKFEDNERLRPEFRHYTNLPAV